MLIQYQSYYINENSALGYNVVFHNIIKYYMITIQYEFIFDKMSLHCKILYII